MRRKWACGFLSGLCPSILSVRPVKVVKVTSGLALCPTPSCFWDKMLWAKAARGGTDHSRSHLIQLTS